MLTNIKSLFLFSLKTNFYSRMGGWITSGLRLSGLKGGGNFAKERPAKTETIDER